MAEPNREAPISKPAAAPPVVVKKYANRRLYNTETSSYITLDTLADMVRLGRDFVVYDAKSGDDITRSVLTQIIVEEEGKGRSMLPIPFLRQLIGFYGDNLQGLVPRYLEQAMAAFAQQQKQVQDAVGQTMGRMFPFGNMEEIGRQNIAMMERAMAVWSPFYRPQHGAAAPEDAPREEVETQEVAALRAEVASLRGELAACRAAAQSDKKPTPAGVPVPSEPAKRPEKTRQPVVTNTKA